MTASVSTELVEKKATTNSSGTPSAAIFCLMAPSGRFKRCMRAYFCISSFPPDVAQTGTLGGLGAAGVVLRTGGVGGAGEVCGRDGASGGVLVAV